MQNLKDTKTALDRAARLVAERPAFGQRTYYATATLNGSMECLIREKHHDLIADVPPGMGGTDQGPSPSCLLRAAMASCVAIGIRSFAIRAEVEVEQVQVRFETDVDARGQLGVCASAAPGFEAGRLQISVYSCETPDAVKAVVQQSLTLSPMLDAVRCRTPIETCVKVILTQETAR
ncbi:MAG: OsmC family protein [Pseudomonadota bacterium]